MKKHYLLFFLFTALFAKAQEPFITTWEAFDPLLTIEVPVVFDEENSFTVDFGDGTILTDQQGSVFHTYDEPGIYTVSLSGNFNQISFLDNDTAGHIKTIEQWGDIQWTSMENAFHGCGWLVINATDAPDLSQVENMSGMFATCNNLYQSQPIENWDVSNVTNMSGMFIYTHLFNLPLNGWNVSNVTDMSAMFAHTHFNQALDNWDVSGVTTMQLMFNSAEHFNQPLDSWDVSNVTNMHGMFNSAAEFDQPLENWDVSNVTDMSEMFAGTSFNQPLNNWDVSGVTDMRKMFAFNHVFNQPLSDWNVSNVLNMAGMFSQAIGFNQDLSVWDFNIEVHLANSNDLGFISSSGIDVSNYDALLLRFAQLGLEGKVFYALNLEYCNSEVHEYLDDEMGWGFFNSDDLAEGCLGNTISGNIQLDTESNGCDAEDIAVTNFLIQGSDGVFTYSTMSSDGQYNLTVFENTYNIEFLNLPDYISISPTSSEITFEGFGNEETLNFCLTANETIADLNITLLPLGEARPGFPAEYQVVVQNMGTQTVADATVTLTFDDALLLFVEASPAPASSATNQLTFEIEDLQPLESNMIDIAMEVFAPPAVNGGEMANFTAGVTDEDDNTPADNTFALEQEIVNSYDPNDKRVLEGEWIYEEQTDGYLNYIIRFQNTGTASAITVRIEDILHENLDWTTLMPVSASHNYRVQITDGNHVEFIFDDINLPHEEADEEGSNGFIAYKIKPVAGIQAGDIMSGNASIYFDFNLPIITNTVTTEVIVPMEAGSSQINISCNGESNGSASVSVEEGWGDYTYSWSPSGGNAATASGLSAGEYTVTITDGTGDSIVVDFTITQPEAITITTQPEDAMATTGSDAAFSVNAANVEEYQWQVSTNGTDWADITNGGTKPAYSGVATDELSIADIPLGHDGYLYRVVLVNGDDCTTYSEEAELAVTEAANTILAVNDDFSAVTILEGTGGTAGDVTANDLFNDAPVNDTAIIITVTDDGGLTGAAIDAEGNLTVPTTAEEGTFTIGYSICEAEDETNCSNATATMVVSAVSGIEDHKAIDVAIYPNPASDKLYLQAGTDITVQGVEIYNMQGRCVLSSKGQPESLDISDLSTGVYLVEIKTDKGSAKHKLIKN